MMARNSSVFFIKGIGASHVLSLFIRIAERRFLQHAGWTMSTGHADTFYHYESAKIEHGNNEPEEKMKR